MFGCQASGKSFLATQLAAAHPAYKIVNQDTLKTKVACVNAVRAYLSQGESVIVDNTNRDAATRCVFFFGVLSFNASFLACIQILDAHIFN